MMGLPTPDVATRGPCNTGVSPLGLRQQLTVSPALIPATAEATWCSPDCGRSSRQAAQPGSHGTYQHEVRPRPSIATGSTTGTIHRDRQHDWGHSFQQAPSEDGEERQLAEGSSFINPRLSELGPLEGDDGGGAAAEELSEERAAELRAELQAALVAHAAGGSRELNERNV